jgi:hypothetical protein
MFLTFATHVTIQGMREAAQAASSAWNEDVHDIWVEEVMAVEVVVVGGGGAAAAGEG